MFKLFLEASGEDSGRTASISTSRVGPGAPGATAGYTNSERGHALDHDDRDVIDGGPWRGRWANSASQRP